ncbi:MAG: MarR family transcriptional regulator [Candidatus Izemoplasma sp.]
MKEEIVRKSFNIFLKMYFDSCREVYEEINFKEVTGRQFKYLKEIFKNEKMSPSSLAKAFDLSKPTITEIINKFLDAKLIVKEDCINDKRKYFIRLTKRGELLAKSNELESKKAVAKMFDKLSAIEIDNLVTIFNKFEVEDL